MEDNRIVYFVGCGPGDPDLITLKARNMMEKADVIVYSGSLINPRILEYARQDAQQRGNKPNIVRVNKAWHALDKVA
jgi:precorrin-4/cobalt-precorrin-4 C11-methyltransferase